VEVCVESWVALRDVTSDLLTALKERRVAPEVELPK